MYSVFCLHISLQARKGHQISLQMVVSTCGCWDLNSGPLEEQTKVLTTEASLQPPKTCFEISDFQYKVGFVELSGTKKSLGGQSSSGVVLFLSLAESPR